MARGTHWGHFSGVFIPEWEFVLRFEKPISAPIMHQARETYVSAALGFTYSFIWIVWVSSRRAEGLLVAVAPKPVSFSVETIASHTAGAAKPRRLLS